MNRHHPDGVMDGVTKKSLIAVLYLGCTGGSGTGNFYSDFPVDLKQTSAGETGKSKRKYGLLQRPENKEENENDKE